MNRFCGHGRTDGKPSNCADCATEADDRIAALEAELKKRPQTASIGVGDGKGQMFVNGTYAAVRVLQEKILRWEGIEQDRDRLQRENAGLWGALENLAECADRARGLLRENGGNWGMLDTTKAREALAATEAQEDGDE
jgi:hypothetical protein